MPLTAKVDHLKGPSDEKHWGGSFSQNGLFILVETKESMENPAAGGGNKIINLLVSEYERAPEKNLSLLKKLLEKIKNESSLTTLLITILCEDILYLGERGTGDIYIKRGEKIGRLISNEETSSGNVQAGDLILMVSKISGTTLDWQKILTSQDLEGIIQKISETLSQQEAAGAAAILLSIMGKEEPKFFESSFMKEVQTGDSWQEKIFGPSLRFKSLLKKWQDQFLRSEERVQSKKTLLSVAIILIILLTVSIFLNINHTRESKGKQKLGEVLDLVTHQYDEAVSLTDLNPLLARTLLSDSKLSLSALFSEFPKNSSEYKKISEWIKKISEQEVAAYKIFKLTSVPLFFDLSLIKTAGEAQKMAAYKETAVFLDAKNQVVYSLGTSTKQASIIAGSETVKDGGLISLHGKTAYILNSEGILGIDISSKTARLVVKTDSEWGEITALESYGGNLYLLDKKNSKIWKYIATETGFLSRQNYLNPDVKTDFSQSKKMVIDGSVWILSASSSILTFSRGLGEPFVFKGFSDTLENISTIFTSDTAKNLYILDKTGSRILVFEKDGTYISQYQWEGIKDAVDVIVSEEQGKIFLLEGSKIYAIDIK